MFSFTEVDQTIRILTKTDYWQSLYHQSKELSGVYLFENNSNFTTYQVSFLANLSFYSNIYMDIAMGERLATDSGPDPLREGLHFLRWTRALAACKIAP